MAKDATDLLEIEDITLLVDTGYYKGTEIKDCIDDGLKGYMKKAKVNKSTKDNEFRKEKFSYDKGQDIYICPAGKTLAFLKIYLKKG